MKNYQLAMAYVLLIFCQAQLSVPVLAFNSYKEALIYILTNFNETDGNKKNQENINADTIKNLEKRCEELNNLPSCHDYISITVDKKGIQYVQIESEIKIRGDSGNMYYITLICEKNEDEFNTKRFFPLDEFNSKNRYKTIFKASRDYSTDTTFTITHSD